MTNKFKNWNNKKNQIFVASSFINCLRKEDAVLMQYTFSLSPELTQLTGTGSNDPQATKATIINQLRGDVMFALEVGWGGEVVISAG